MNISSAPKQLDRATAESDDFATSSIEDPAATCWEEGVNWLRCYPGMPLPAPQREFFQRGFNCSLDPIRLHVNRDIAEALGAEAFAVGRHIVLREMPRDWNAPFARYLLAHEIAHCLQQRAVCDAAPVVGIGIANHPFEREAHRAATHVFAARPVGLLSQETCAVVRRVISIVPSAAPIRVKQRPTVKTPEIDSLNQMLFNSEWIKLDGSVVLTGAEGDDLSGITLGWINIEWLERGWAIYRGERDDHGSLIIQRDTPAARKNVDECRDTIDPSGILVDNHHAGLDRSEIPANTKISSSSPTYTLRVVFHDAPGDIHVTKPTNRKTNQPNYLHEARIEMRFCTILTLLWPNKRFQHLSNIMWLVRWWYSFKPPTPARPFWDVQQVFETKHTVDRAYPGAPDAPWAKLLTDPKAPNCIKVADQALRNPTAIYSTRWEDFEEQRMQDQYTP